jgi:hypothetical protein
MSSAFYRMINNVIQEKNKEIMVENAPRLVENNEQQIPNGIKI